MTARFRHIAPATVALIFLAACGSDDGSSDTTTVDATTAAAGDGTVAEAAGGLQVTSVDFGAATAVLSNAGEEPIDLSGHWVCNRPSYAELPAVVLAPGEETEIGIAGVNADGGEVAIYSSDAFSSSTDIVVYVHWGTGGGRASVAEDAGIWSGAPVGSVSTVIELTGDPASAAGWE